MRAALCASRREFFPWFGALGSSRVWGGEKVRNSSGVDPRIIPVFADLHFPICDWVRLAVIHALHQVRSTLVATAGVAVLVMFMVFLSWSCSMAFLTLVLLALVKKRLIRGPTALARLLVRGVVLTHFDVAACADPFFFFGGAFEDRAPGGVWNRLAGLREIVCKGGFGPPTIVFSWLVGTDDKVGHRAFFISDF